MVLSCTHSTCGGECVLEESDAYFATREDEPNAETGADDPSERTWEIEYGLDPEWTCLFEDDP